MSERVCRWGIMGAATIARKNWQAIRLAENCVLTGVASRDRERAERFIAECQAVVPADRVPRALRSYEELLDSDNVDAVYIPLPTGVRHKWAIRAAEAGKHVLAEKPVGVGAAQVREMVDACRQHNVQFMDGVMFMHSQRLPAIRAVLDDGTSIGRVKRITSQFSFMAPAEFLNDNIRMNSQLEPFGCLGDLGWYNIRFALWVMKEQLPECVSGRLLDERARPDSPATVPVEFSAELLFSGGVSAGFYCSFLTEIQQWANVSGTRGYLHAADFVLPHSGSTIGFDVGNTVFDVRGCDFDMEGHSRHVEIQEYSNSRVNAQETNLFRNFADLALSGQTDPSWGETSLKTQQVLDACLASARQDGKLIPVGG